MRWTTIFQTSLMAELMHLAVASEEKHVLAISINFTIKTLVVRFGKLDFLGINVTLFTYMYQSFQKNIIT